MHGTEQKYIRWVQVYEPEVNKNVAKRSWGMISMSDTVIDPVNLLEK